MFGGDEYYDQLLNDAEKAVEEYEQRAHKYAEPFLKRREWVEAEEEWFEMPNPDRKRMVQETAGLERYLDFIANEMGVVGKIGINGAEETLKEVYSNYSIESLVTDLNQSPSLEQISKLIDLKERQIESLQKASNAEQTLYEKMEEKDYIKHTAEEESLINTEKP